MGGTKWWKNLKAKLGSKGDGERGKQEGRFRASEDGTSIQHEQLDSSGARAPRKSMAAAPTSPPALPTHPFAKQSLPVLSENIIAPAGDTRESFGNGGGYAFDSMCAALTSAAASEPASVASSRMSHGDNSGALFRIPGAKHAPVDLLSRVVTPASTASMQQSLPNSAAPDYIVLGQHESRSAANKLTAAALGNHVNQAEKVVKQPRGSRKMNFISSWLQEAQGAPETAPAPSSPQPQEPQPAERDSRPSGFSFQKGQPLPRPDQGQVDSPGALRQDQGLARETAPFPQQPSITHTPSPAPHVGASEVQDHSHETGHDSHTRKEGGKEQGAGETAQVKSPTRGDVSIHPPTQPTNQAVPTSLMAHAKKQHVEAKEESTVSNLDAPISMGQKAAEDQRVEADKEEKEKKSKGGASPEGSSALVTGVESLRLGGTSPEPTRTIAVATHCPEDLITQMWTVDDFILLRKLYEGNLSVICQAQHKRSGRHVALKIYKRSRLHEMERFQLAREICLHLRILHPYIISLYAAWKDSKYVFLVLEWAPHGNLFDLLVSRGGKLPELEAANLVIKPMFTSLAFLHSQNFIHRDIKLENIVMDSQSQIKLCDFGLAIDQKFEQANTRLGTFGYFAPEVLDCPLKKSPFDFKGDTTVPGYDAKVDCWSAGVVAFELLTGKAPFSASTAAKILDATRNRVLEYPPDLSPGAKAFLAAALTRDPLQRPTAKQLMQHPWLQSCALKQSQHSMSLTAKSP